jgi:hypothetical protein
MRGHRGLGGVALAVMLFASGCGGATATPTAPATATASEAATAAATAAAASESATATATSTPTPTSSPSATVSDLYLRFWSIAPIGPENSFGTVPLVVSGGQLLSVKYPSTADPYPLYVGPTRRTISAAGLAAIVSEAQRDGLLGASASFVCPHGPDDGMKAGTATQHLVLAVGGVSREMTASCPYVEPTPGPGLPAAATWAAFQRFVKLLADPSSWLGAQIGPATAYDPDRLAVLAVPMEAGPDASAETPNPADVMAWPLATPFASFGVAAFGDRCAVVQGADVAKLLPVVKTANVSTVFRDSRGAYASLVVRAFMPGEPSPCGS